MRITIVTDTYSPQTNGVATTLFHLVAGLRQCGHQVDVIRPSVLVVDEEGIGVPSIPLPGYSEVRVGLPMRLRLQLRWSRHRPDVIYVATESPLGASAVGAAKALRIPVATGFHTNFQKYTAHYRLPGLERITLRYLRSLHNRSHRTFAPSRDLIETLDREGFDNLELLPKGVDSDRFHPAKRDHLLRRTWGSRPNAPAGIYVGRIAPEKNLPLIARTFTEMQCRVPDFRGIFVGDGPKKSEMRRRYPRFIYTGALYGEDLSRHYASADLFIFPSTTETFGNVILEALSSGLVTVSYRYAASRQHVTDRINGFQAELNDEAGFVRSALLALDHAFDSELRAEARRTAEKVRWENVAHQFSDSLAKLVQEHNQVENPLYPRP